MKETCWICGNAWSGGTVQIDDTRTCDTYNLCDECIQRIRRMVK